MIDAFTDHFENSMDMRNGTAAQCRATSDCASATSATEMCCSDV